MSEQGIDERRARVMYDLMEGPVNTADFGRQMRQWELCKELTRAIRLSDEAAGYITAKLETLESAKERRG